MPLHEVNNRFQAGRLFAQFDWKLCFMKAGPGLTCETPLSQWTTPLLNGPFVSPVSVEALLFESRIRLDLRDATHLSGQPLPGGPFVCPVLEDVVLWKSRFRLDMRDATPRKGRRFQVGRLYAQCWEKFDSESQIRLDLRDASPRSGQPLPVGRLIAKFWWKLCCERRIRLDTQDALDDTMGDFSKDAFGPEEHGDETHCVPAHVSGSASAMRATHRVDRFWVE